MGLRADLFVDGVCSFVPGFGVREKKKTGKHPIHLFQRHATQVVDLYHKRRNPLKDRWRQDASVRWDPWKRGPRGWVCKHRISVGVSLFSTVTVLDYCFNLAPLYSKVRSWARSLLQRLLGVPSVASPSLPGPPRQNQGAV